MNQDEIFEIAREAYENCDHIPDLKIPKEFIERFAKLIAEKAFDEGYSIGELAGFKEGVKLERKIRKQA